VSQTVCFPDMQCHGPNSFPLKADDKIDGSVLLDCGFSRDASG